MDDKQATKRSWVLVGTWFATIILLGVMKRVLEKQKVF
jgi:preprotein translocase subunit SecG